MLNRITSAGTAAQKRSKNSLFARLPLLLAIPMLCAVGCQDIQTIVVDKTQVEHDSLRKVYSDLHSKYRTLWYRSEQKCFYDSCRKYGLLDDSMYGIKEEDIYRIDTVPFNGSEVCK